jgi:metal-responsive CopG/Arc/MetJ family transcriptional regulator
MSRSEKSQGPRRPGRPKTESPLVQVSTSVEEEVVNWLDQQAEEGGRKRSQQIALIIRQAFRNAMRSAQRHD